MLGEIHVMKAWLGHAEPLISRYLSHGHIPRSSLTSVHAAPHRSQSSKDVLTPSNLSQGQHANLRSMQYGLI